MILILRNNIQNKFWINNNITRKKTRREHYPIEKYGKFVKGYSFVLKQNLVLIYSSLFDFKKY